MAGLLKDTADWFLGLFEDEAPQEGYGLGAKQPTDEERKAIKKIAKKHGINKGQATVINEPGKTPYYMKDGEKIKFK